MNPTETTLRLMEERGISVCQVEGCNNPAEEAHHCLYSKKKGVKQLNDAENLQLVCRKCHKYSGAAKTFENRIKFWEWSCGFYGAEHMKRWNESLPLKVKERYEEIELDKNKSIAEGISNCPSL